MAEETQFTAKTAFVTISTANTNLDGTGTLGTVITGSANGTWIKTLTVKAQGNTTHGMVRLFVYDGTNTRILEEIEVFPITKSGTNPSFEAQINLDFNLKSGYILKASTQNAETFNVIAQAVDWSYYSTSVRADTTQFSAQNVGTTISTANANLNGSGIIAAIYSAGASTSYKGSAIRTITIKSLGNVTSGMIRFFIDDGRSTKILMTEIPIKTITRTAIDESFEYTIDFRNDFDLQAGYNLAASTQNAESFKITVEGQDWNYLP